MKRAWKTTCMGVVSIAAAETRGKAVAITLKSARAVGYPIKFRDVRAVRAPQYDAWAEVDASGHCWGEEDIRRTLENKAAPVA